VRKFAACLLGRSTPLLGGMNDASWLWRDLRDLFEIDDGSLPEIRVVYADRRAPVAGFGHLRKRAARVVTHNPSFWSNERNEDVALETVPDAAALVVSGSAEPFHVVLGGIESSGVVLPDLGVFVFSDALYLDYRMGPAWSEAEVRALFELLAELMAFDSQSSLSLEEGVVPEVAERFVAVWTRWRAEHAA
jgi:hypothetical protein